MLHTRCIFIKFIYSPTKCNIKWPYREALQMGLDFSLAKMLNLLSLFFLVNWTFAFHPITLPNRMLVSRVYRSLQDCDWLNCIQACQEDPHCISYNFIHSVHGLGVCEMIDCGLDNLCGIKSQLVFLYGALFQQLASPGVR